MRQQLLADPLPKEGRLWLQAPGTFTLRPSAPFFFLLRAAAAPRLTLTRAPLSTTKPPKTGGHYTAHALQPDGSWYRFNDAIVSHVPGGAQQVGRERAYLLVYQRVA